MSPIVLAADQLGHVLAHAERIERLYLQRWLAAVADQLIGRELSDAAVRDAIDVADRMIGVGVPACSGAPRTTVRMLRTHKWEERGACIIC